MREKSPQEIAFEKQQAALKDLVECGCGDSPVGSFDHTSFDRLNMDWLVKNLPGFDYVLNRLMNYIFSNGLTTGNDDDDVKLDEWLFEERNLEGTTNYNVLRDVIAEAHSTGECGLRMKDGNLYHYPKGKYGIITRKDEGIQEVLAYFIKKDGKEIEGDYRFKDLDTVVDYESIARYFEDTGFILLSPGEFVNVRNNTKELQGVNPFTHDRQRLNLLLSVYERLNYDIDYDGPGRILLHTKDGFVEGDENDISSGEVLENDHETRYQAAKAEVKRIATDIKTSSSDNVIVLSGNFEDDITHLPRTTKATEFFGWLEEEVVIISEILGMSPTLMETGKLHGNISVEAVIDNAMLNTIVPMRENYAVQFSKMIADNLNISKVYFDKYQLKQVEDENIIRKNVAEIIKDLATADKASPNDKVRSLIDDFTDYLRDSIFDENNKLMRL